MSVLLETVITPTMTFRDTREDGQSFPTTISFALPLAKLLESDYLSIGFYSVTFYVNSIEFCSQMISSVHSGGYEVYFNIFIDETAWQPNVKSSIEKELDLFIDFI